MQKSIYNALNKAIKSDNPDCKKAAKYAQLEMNKLHGANRGQDDEDEEI